jgi:hypothetical protein
VKKVGDKSVGSDERGLGEYLVRYGEEMHEIFSMMAPHHFNDVEKYVIWCQSIIL